MKSIDKKYCQQVQNSLNFDLIESVWKNFRQAGNSIQGKIAKLNFKKVMNRNNYTNDSFLDRFFDRFKLDKMDKPADFSKQDKQQIDLQDFVIGLTVLSRLGFLDKIKYIFQLTDLDEDGCLSLQEIQAMIERIQRIFSKENSSAKVNSYSLLLSIAQKRAERNYNQLLFLLKKNNQSLTDDDEGLITCDEFIEALRSSRNLYADENFLPLNLSLYEIINNVASEPTIKIHEQNKYEFCEFRKQVYSILQNKSQKEGSNLIKYPGKIQIIRNQKVIDVLPAFQRQQKKSSKLALKKNISIKNNQNSQNNSFGDLYDEKLAEQTLESYKMKVKKMIQTKTDPRLNVHFDRQVRK